MVAARRNAVARPGKDDGMEWFDDPDQRLIDATLDRRIAEIMEVQAAIYCEEHRKPDDESQFEYDLLRKAHYHLSADLAVLQPMSCVPF
jgi:hypothetical protein